MDEKTPSHRGHAGEHAASGATIASAASEVMQQAKTTANQVMEQAKTTANQAIEQAKTMARDVGEQARAVAADPGATAQELARRAREQASVAGDVLYRRGQRAGDYISQNVNEYPLTALLIAGMIGYGLAYLIHSQWQDQPSWRD